jgi:dolichol-phosphate mannosyltransferase
LALHVNLPDVHLQIVTIDDGSNDGTWNGLLEMGKRLPVEQISVKLTGNFGSYNAFLAGLHYATGDYFVQLHADLQDPPKHIPEMLKAAEDGFKLVIGVRTNREEPWLSKMMSGLYHKMVKSIALPHIPEGGYDLILFDQSIRNQIVQMNESNINLVYLISSLKHPYAVIPVTRLERKQGKSQWNLSKKRKLWIDTVVGFSYSPVKWLTNLAVASFLVNLLFLFFFWLYSSLGIDIRIVVTLILASLQLVIFGLALVAEYLWRTLEASRKRPPFVVDQVITNS